MEKAIELKQAFFIAITASLLLASCAPRVPFTQADREKYQLDVEDLKGIQFYVSKDIVLTRGEKATKEKGTNEGTLIVKSGKAVDQVVIRAGTPGLVEKVIDGNRIAISFETEGGKHLVFGDPKDKKGAYTLLAAKWNKNNRGQVKYGDQMYYTSNGAANTYLQFKIKKLNNYKKEQRVVGGRKL